MKRFLRQAYNFVEDVIVLAKDKTIEFFKGLYNHAESVITLTLASIGVNALLSELPFYFSVPMWVEIPMVIPVVSVLLISLLMVLSIWRHEHTIAIA